jgi:hypothetical protein
MFLAWSLYAGFLFWLSVLIFDMHTPDRPVYGDRDTQMFVYSLFS